LAGSFVAYWAVIAVFIYYYEVLARYVFNAPTNWAHEGMFLMFGMQYLLAGGYAYREESHVRVDVLYEKRSVRTKAIIDLVTSVFFFIFVLALVWTGAIFALDAIQVQETTLNEWGIQYWPVKLAIPLGGFLLLLQGIAKLIRDILYLRGVRGGQESVGR
jgi:TRAP-type mannitol/chloroaromatic compound transport system permease small subunit